MGRFLRFALFVAAAVAVLTVPLSASAGHENDPRTPNLQPLGHIFEPKRVFGGDGNFHTDIAFWGKNAYQGSWNGFNIRNIRNPLNPTHVSATSCSGPQGDVVVWKNILVRTWDVPAGSPGLFGAGLQCDGQPVTPGWQGLHVFDISNKVNPVLVASVELPCGSHTASGVPDRRNQRLIVYSSPSAHSNTNPNPPATCDWFDIVEVPFRNPAGAQRLGQADAEHTCHDVGVILGRVMKAACAGGNGTRVFSIGGSGGGSLTNPLLKFHTSEPDVTIGHSAAWTWDGEVLIFGHEPGGGVAAECEATDDPRKRTYFFYDGDDGQPLGSWTLPRTQSSTENCTLHNLNVVPVKNRYVLVHGSYQSGTSVVDFTDPAHAQEIAWSDPPPVVPTDLSGAWSSYWYNGLIYETNIGEGLNIFRLTGSETRHAKRVDHLNPQTQEFSFKADDDEDDDDDD